MSRILIYESRSVCDDFSQLLAGHGHEVTVYTERETLFAAMVVSRPEALVYVLGDLMLDLAILSLVRRMAPTLPIILLGGPAGIEARRSVQELKPTYYAIFPLDPAELSDAVNGALGHPHLGFSRS